MYTLIRVLQGVPIDQSIGSVGTVNKEDISAEKKLIVYIGVSLIKTS